MTTWRPAGKAIVVKKKQEFDELERQAMSTLVQNETAPSKAATTAKADASLNSSASKSASNNENSFRKLV